MTRLEEISEVLGGLGYPFSEFSKEATDTLSTILDQKISNLQRSEEKSQREISDLRQSIASNLSLAEFSDNDLKVALSELKERGATAASLYAKLISSFASFPWPEERPLSEFLIEAKSMRKVAVELQTALEREKQSESRHREWLERKESLQARLSELQLRVRGFANAQSTLKAIRKENSLESAIHETLEKNRLAIESIFSRIHSPSEFRGLGASWKTLIRKADGSEAKLSEISSGQRAAFALSIFLAQNAQLTVAPPVVLIDDPIAHVDDLNSLSFLDFLREIVLKGKRQIFFATANEKMATLFERKSDFLGSEGFQKFKLTRQTYLAE